MEIFKNKINKDIFFFINILFFPFLYISGSLLLNLLIIITIVSAFYFSQNNLLKNFFNKYKYYIFLLFLFFIFNLIYSETKAHSSSKIILYFRFFIFPLCYIFIISQLTDFNLKKIANIFLYLMIFVMIDCLIQLIFGKDIFGFSYFYPYNRITGPFGDEMIVGFYLLNFGILTTAFLNYFNLIKKNTNFYILLFLAIMILLTGERSAFLSFLYFLFFLFIISKNKKIIFLTSISIIIAFLILINSFSFLNNKYPIQNILQDYITIDEKTKLLPENQNEIKSKDLIQKNINNYIPLNKWKGHFEKAYAIIKKNIFLGSGFRSYRITCLEYQKKYFAIKNASKITDIYSKCSTHPHNFHIEILSDNGVFGYLIFLIFVIYFFTTFIKGKHNNNFGITILFCLILSFVVPFKTTGSIFTTNYAFVFWYLIANYFFLIKKRKSN